MYNPYLSYVDKYFPNAVPVVDTVYLICTILFYSTARGIYCLMGIPLLKRKIVPHRHDHRASDEISDRDGEQVSDEKLAAAVASRNTWAPNPI